LVARRIVCFLKLPICPAQGKFTPAWGVFPQLLFLKQKNKKMNQENRMHLNGLENAALPADLIVSEQNDSYHFMRSVSEREIIDTAKALLGRRMLKTSVITNAQVAKDFFLTHLSALEHEVFCVAFLNIKHRVIVCEPLFRGTFNSAPVYPREVVHRALALNAAAVILAHNHPSGDGEPSQADRQITVALIAALNWFDIQVLDHLVIAGSSVTSFAEQGWLQPMLEKAKRGNSVVMND
jgi:DNA repair protein RadC